MNGNLIKHITIAALIFNQFCFINSAYAANNDIAIDSSSPANYQPQIKSSANGTDVIDITAPTGSGVSINHWERLNNTSGMIFNNSQYDGNSQTGGFVAANVNMSGVGSSAAAVILNQVNGTGRSRFTAPTEIFGSQAQFIVSNPNGITCNGCSFIGAPKVTLTTGTANYNGVGGDWNRTFSVDGASDIEIGSNGFLGFTNDGNSANDVTYADIIARSVSILGQINSANEVNIITGRNDYNYDTGVATKKADDGSAKPSLAIDGSLLGSITTGRIKFIATEEGVGVRSLGNLASNASDIEITADGNVHIRNLNSANNINITSSNSSIDAGQLESDRDINLAAKENININNDLTSGQDTILTSTGDASNGVSGNINIDSVSTINSARDILIFTQNNLRNDGTLIANYNLEIRKEQSNLDDINNKINELEKLGNITIQNDLKIYADNLNNNTDSIAALRDIEIKTSDYTNQTLIQSGRNLALNLTGTLTNNSTSRIHSDNNLHIIADKIDNQGVIDSDNNLRLKATNSNASNNSIINNGLIYSEGQTSLYSAADILNTKSIYSVDNLNIGDKNIDKNIATDLDPLADTSSIPTLALTKNFTNSSGSIESENDVDVELEEDFTNKRTKMRYQTVESRQTQGGEFANWTRFYRSAGELTDLSRISIANDFNVNIGGNFVNDASSIMVGNNIDITANSLSNNAYTLYNYNHMYWGCDRHVCKDWGIIWQGVNETYQSLIHAGNSVTLNLNGSVATTTSNSNPILASLTNSGTIYGGQNVSVDADSSILNQALAGVTITDKQIDLSLFIPTIDGVVTRINVEDKKDIINPSYSFYLINRIYEFDPAKYAAQSRIIDQIRRATGSSANKAAINSCIADGNSADHCLSLSSLDLDTTRQFILQTDPKTENDIISKAALKMTGNAFFTTTATNSEEDRSNLYTNTAIFAATNLDLDLTFGNELTEEQQAKLTDPIIWYVNQTIDGKKMLVAKVYLPKTHNNKNNSGTIYAKNNINLNSNNGDIINIGGTVKANNNLTLTANNGSITNQALINYKINGQDVTEDQALNSNANNIRSTLLSKGTLEAGNNINLTAANDINNIASNIIAGNDASLTTTNGDINIATAQLRDRTVINWGSKKKGGTSTRDNVTNVESEISVGGRLDLVSGNDILVKGSNVNTGTDSSAADKSLNLTSVGDVNIEAAQDTAFFHTASWKKGTTTSKSSTNGFSSLTNIHTELTANNGGNININSGIDINLIGAKLAGNDIAINAGEELNIYSVEDKYDSWATSTKSRSLGGGLGGLVKVLTAIVAAPIAVASLGSGGGSIMGIGSNMMKGDVNLSSKSSSLEKGKTTNIASVINADGNVNLTSNNNLTIKGSTLSGSTGSIVSTSGDVNIINVKDSEYSKSSHSSSKTTFSSVGAGLVNAIATAGTVALTANNVTIDPRNKEEKIEDAYKNFDLLPQKQKLTQTENINETIIASNLNFNNLTINSGQDTNVRSSNLTTTAGDLTINSGINGEGSTNILTDTENDYSYSFTQKKSPSIMAAIGNGIAQNFSAMMPSFGNKNESTTKSNDETSELAFETNSNKTSTTTKTNVASNITSANDLNITSQDNNLISGSNLGADNDINLNSTTGTTIITSAEDSSTTSTESVSQDYNKAYFDYNKGRVSANSESNINENDSTTTTVTQVASNLGANGNINISSQKDINILSSNLTAENQINLLTQEGNINILAKQNTVSNSSENRSSTLTLSAGVGNAAIDTAYAEYDLIKAIKEVADAKKELNHMETLHKNGQADSDAVEDAKINLTIATLNVAMAQLKVAASAAKTAESAKTFGFYADLQLHKQGTKTNTNYSSVEEIASSLLANNNINITSGSSLLSTSGSSLNEDQGNTNIKGSIASVNGDINITSANNTNITALKSTTNSSTKSESNSQTITLASSAAATTQIFEQLINNLTASIAAQSNKSNSNSSSTNYTNTTLTAQNGNIKINTKDDASIKGANLLAENIELNTVGDLSVESLQNSTHSKSKSKSFNIGGGVNSISLGYNQSTSKFDRDWVDDQTSIIGTNSVTINTGNNTNIKGAVITNSTNGQIGEDAIDGRNLTINTASLTFENIQDTEKQSTNGFGFSTNIGKGISSNNSNPNQDKSFYPTGSTTLSLQSEGYEKEQTTYATIGQGNVTIGGVQTFDNNGNLVSSTGGTTNDQAIIASLNRDITNTQDITKDTITGALNTSLTVDNRFFTAEGFNSLSQDVANFKENFKKATDAQIHLPEELIDTGIWAAYAAYDKFIPTNISDPGKVSLIRTQIRQAALDAKANGNKDSDIETLREKIKELTNKTPTNQDLKAIIELTNDRDFGQLMDNIGNTNYQRFLDKYTLSVGVFFDGTNNSMERDKPKGEESNVARMYDNYDSTVKPIYVNGVGTSEANEALNIFGQATGYGMDKNQQEAQSKMMDIFNNNQNVLFFPLDVVGFSRGGTTALNFVNKINNENYWNLGILTRSELLFDPVGSYSIAGNNNDLGRDFSVPKNIIAIQINAKDEVRHNFSLQSLSNSDGSLDGKHWTEITLPGVHSDIGGSYANGYQGKDQNMALYSMQTMVNKSSEYGINFNTPTNQMPTPEFNQLMSLYRLANTNYNINSTSQNLVKLNDLERTIKNSSVHDSTFSGTGELPNYSFGDRNVYYPNEQRN